MEIEKKFVFTPEVHPLNGFAMVREILELRNGRFVENMDTYYDIGDSFLQKRVQVRRRNFAGKQECTIKIPVVDGDITRRIEKNFTSLSDVLLFLQKEWGTKNIQLEEKMILNTSRIVYDYLYQGGVFEVSLDQTVGMKDDKKYLPIYMVEIEYKEGRKDGLDHLSQLMLEHPFIQECFHTKKEMVEKQVEAGREMKLLRKKGK